MAVHGGELLSQASLFPSLEAALADCERVVATTGRIEGEPLPLQAPVTALSWLLEGGPRSRAALVFGREDRGLANGELLQAGRLLQIGTGPSYPSLNLSHAVAVVLHELHGLRHGSSPPLQAMPSAAPAGEAAGSAWPDPCRRDALEAALAAGKAVMLTLGEGGIDYLVQIFEQPAPDVAPENFVVAVGFPLVLETGVLCIRDTFNLLQWEGDAVEAIRARVEPGCYFVELLRMDDPNGLCILHLHLTPCPPPEEALAG